MRLEALVDDTKHLALLPVGGMHPLAGLRFEPAGLVLTVPGHEPLRLPWQNLGALDSTMDRKEPRDGWTVVPWSAGRSGVFGLGVRLSGLYESEAEEMLEATATLWRRVNGATGSSLTGKTLPVLPSNWIFTAFTAERDTISTLCVVLALTPSLLARLDDAERMQRLAQDLRKGMARRPTIADGLGRDATDIHVAMTEARCFHRFGRPLSAASLPAEQPILEELEKRLRSNAFRTGRATDPAELRRIVRKNYLDIAPWPFAALVDP